MRVGIDARILGHPKSGIAAYAVGLLEQFLNFRDLEIILFGDRPINNEYRFITDKFETFIFGQNHRKCWAQFYLPIELKRKKIDLYHAVWNNAVPVFTNVPGVLTVHDLIPLVVNGYFKKKRKKYRYILSMYSALHKAKFIIVDAENTKIDLMKYFNIPEEKINVVYLGLSKVENIQDGIINLSDSVRKKFGVKDQYIINIGSFDIRRNAGTLIEAFADFVRKTKTVCKLVLIGGYGNFKNEINRLHHIAAGLKIDDKVIFTNCISEEDKLLLLVCARLMVHPSLYEGFCFPVLESMRAGVPVIASNTGSIPEVAADAAYLIDPVDKNMLVGAIEKLWYDDSIREEFIRKGFNRLKNFSWEKTAKRTEEIYRKVFLGN